MEKVFFMRIFFVFLQQKKESEKSLSKDYITSSIVVIVSSDEVSGVLLIQVFPSGMHLSTYVKKSPEMITQLASLWWYASSLYDTYSAMSLSLQNASGSPPYGCISKKQLPSSSTKAAVWSRSESNPGSLSQIEGKSHLNSGLKKYSIPQYSTKPSNVLRRYLLRSLSSVFCRCFFSSSIVVIFLVLRFFCLQN